SLISLFCLTVALGYKFYQVNSKVMDDSWETFSNKTPKKEKTISWPSTKTELKFVKSPIKQKRKPSSLSPNLPKVITIDGRELIGKSKTPAKNLKWTNKFNPNWKKVLGNKLLRFQKHTTKVLVKRNKSVIQVKNDRGRLMEHVTVSYLLGGDDISSFTAWVDSETGELIRTWNKTIKEPIGHEKPSMTPTGTL
ncbi:MAG: hypothetical protein KC493_09550, partial [Bacteriovoracaceae bacterium]|nr:hypothetical protein [Bacteriovoracaceae bacterium]